LELLSLTFNSTPVDLLIKQGFLSFVPDEEQTKRPNVTLHGDLKKIFSLSHPTPRHFEGMLNIIRLLIYENELELRSLSGFGGSEEAFLLLKQQSTPPYYSTSFHERASIAFSLINNPFVTASMFEIALSEGEPKADSYKYQDVTGKSLLHVAAEAFGLSASLARSEICKRNRLVKPSHDLLGK
jgi:hypothetical protein